MINLFFRLYDPNEDGASGGGVPAGISTDSDMNFAKAMESSEEPKQEESVSHETPTETVDDKDVKEEDPEFDVGFEEEAGKGNAKYKLSELRQQAKWLHENKEILRGSLKIREEAQKNPTFGKALQTLINKAYNQDGTFNGAEVDGILAKLEAQEAKVENKIEDKTDEIADMENDLQELDADSPHAKILQKNILAAKKIRQELSQALEQNKKFQERLDGLEKFQGNITKEKETAVVNDQVKRLSDLYGKEIGALTDATKSDGYKFVDDNDKADFDRAVRDGVAAKSQSIKSDEDFIKTVKETAKAVYDTMTKRREAWINDYLRKKGALPKEGAPKVEPKRDRTFEEMGALLGDAALTPSQ